VGGRPTIRTTARMTPVVTAPATELSGFMDLPC
jgi:hypothetical protein